MSGGNFQDDSREEEMRSLFGLFKDETEGRSGIDAYLDLDGVCLPFELKTTSHPSGSVTTVRDFGPDHISKWKNKHWLFGFYTAGAVVFKYGSPKQMEAWIAEKEAYISPDFKLAEIAYQNISVGDLYKILPKKQVYSLNDAKSIQKRQYSAQKYLDMMDVANGYSSERMLQILQDRARYLVERGSTLNNPHIPGGYFEGWIEITANHQKVLKQMVRKALKLKGSS